MWRWVTRGLVLTLAVALFAPALLAQGFVGDLELPGSDPSIVHSGMILVRGWVLSPIDVSRIELYVDDQFRHKLNRNLPRIDIEQAFPNYPGIHVTQPGFQSAFRADLLTNGAHTVELKVFLTDGTVQFLGRRTITVNNTVNQAPFGSVDIPHLGGVHNVVGSFPVNGWAADVDGIDRVNVKIDGNVMQAAMYGDPRPDVGNSFPDFPPAMFSGFVANVETTRIQNGVHLMTVEAIDKRGLARTIGTRQIQVVNNALFLRPFGVLDEPLRDAVLYGENCTGAAPIISPFVRPGVNLTPVRGWALDLSTRDGVGRVAQLELLIDNVRWASTDDCGIVGGRFANCYGLPRFDVQRFYPTYEDAPRAGFLLLMDVGALVSRGVRQGNHFLKVRVADREQTFTELPNRDGIPVWFECVDQTFDFPSIGFIDFPEKTDYVAGMVTFHGWALDRQNIAAIEIVIDGNFVGTAQYGFQRGDVADAHPEYPTANVSGWRFTMDTTKLENAEHRLTVRAIDTVGRNTILGSVDFYTQNNK
jgi:Bacterial Ig domain